MNDSSFIKKRRAGALTVCLARYLRIRLVSCCVVTKRTCCLTANRVTTNLSPCLLTRKTLKTFIRANRRPPPLTPPMKSIQYICREGFRDLGNLKRPARSLVRAPNTCARIHRSLTGEELSQHIGIA